MGMRTTGHNKAQARQDMIAMADDGEFAGIGWRMRRMHHYGMPSPMDGGTWGTTLLARPSHIVTFYSHNL